jgi:hypothetical protein
MRQFVVRFTGDTELTYNLYDEEIVDSWVKLIADHTINDCCHTNHYVGYASDDLIQQRINRLYEVADIINSHVPNRVIKQDISKDDWEQALHVMHVHFPDLKNNDSYKHIWNELSEYNDIIHWLESTFKNSGSSNLRITLDFNKANTKFLPIPDSAYKLFTPFFAFGQLLLHYTHVGKHAQELFAVNDFVCPKDQFVPQRTYSASVRMLLTDNHHDTQQKQQTLMNRWKLFYYKRGIDFWGYDINDPKLAFGYMKIGELSSISVNGETVSIPNTVDELNDFRKTLVSLNVLDWKINGA